MNTVGAAEERQPGTIVLAADLVLPLGGIDPIPHGAIAIRDGVVVGVGPLDRVTRIYGEPHMMSGATLLPGLVDAHDHLHGWRADPVADSADATEDALGEIAASETMRHLSKGVTLVRVLGTPHREDLTLRGRAAPNHKWRLPALSCAGLAITGTSGPSAMARVVLDADEARRAVDDEVEHGADWIKVLVSRGIDAAAGTMSAPTLGPEVVHAVVAQARSLGRRVAAHAHGETAIGVAVDAEVDSVEHGTGLTSDLASAMAEQRIALVPTLTTYRRLALRGGEIGLPSAWRSQAASMLDAHSRASRIALDNGVAVAAGSDGFGDLVEELVALSDLGLGPMGALMAGITGGADLVAPGSGQGRIAPGAAANIAVAGDVLTDLTGLREARLVFLDGHLVANLPDGPKDALLG